MATFRDYLPTLAYEEFFIPLCGTRKVYSKLTTRHGNAIFIFLS